MLMGERPFSSCGSASDDPLVTRRMPLMQWLLYSVTECN